MYDWMEAQILYLLIRVVRPEVIVEISPHYGYSTGFILLAMNRNDRGRLLSFDLEQRFHNHALRNFERAGIDPSRQEFFAGDVRHVYHRALPDTIDLLFMDSDHSCAFAEWYIANLYPRVAEDGLIHAHDVLKYGIKPHLGDKGEGKALWDFIRLRQIPETEFLYVSEFVRNQPTKPDILQKLERYPFGETSMATNSIEQNAALWIVRRF
jgi:predicted O-methyltransferase YrrM